jgi:hypothetical protein
MAVTHFEMGGNVTLRGEFRTPKTASPPSQLIDPAAVTLTFQKPDKTSVIRTYGIDDVTRVSAGIYTSIVVLDQEGTYHWRWRGANGAEAGVASGQFDSTRESNF